MEQRHPDGLRQALAERFGEDFATDTIDTGRDALTGIAAHRVIRRYTAQPVSPDLLRTLCACALSAPSKSDLQQADILIVRDPDKRATVFSLLPDMPWLAESQAFLIFLANGSRLPMIAERHGTPFPNDHFDLVFNATVDAAIVMTTFIRAAEAIGLGCCPISMIRDHAARLADVFSLPQKVVPVAGLALGWPAETSGITPRLPLSVTVHEDCFDDADVMEGIDVYDRRRHAMRPFRRQRGEERFGTLDFYGWSADKARQYASPARADFGAFVRQQGFKLD